MDPEFATTAAATTSTSTSNSTGSREQEEDKSTVIPLPAIDQKAKTSATTSSSSSVKKSGGGGGRRSLQKKVVSVPIADVDGSRPKGAGEGAPPSDSWAWRKYGQKPIKGSPYPRGYYRCSSSKGCPARKQVERSCVDPTMLVVTYAADHNHPWPLPKNHHHHHHHHPHNHNSHNPTPAPSPTTEIPPPVSQEQQEGSPTPAFTATTTTNTSSSSPEETTTFSADLGEDDSPMMSMAEGFCWHPYVSEASLPSVAMMLPVSYDDVSKELSSAAGSSGSGSGGGGDEEDSLFAGLGELPECSMVFRRGFSVGAA